MKNISQVDIRRLGFPKASLPDQAELLGKTARMRAALLAADRGFEDCRDLRTRLLGEIFE